MRCFPLALLVLLASAAEAQTPADARPGDYAVTTAGDTLRGDVEYKTPLLGRAHVLIDGERHETDAFRSLYLDGETLAVVDGRQLARLVRDGRVRFYSRSTHTPGMMTPNAGPGGGMTMTPGTSNTVGYLQVGEGPVVRASMTNLRDALGDNPESARYLDQHRTLGYARWAATGASVAVLVAGLVPMVNDYENGAEYKLNPLVVVGLGGVALSNFVFPRLGDQARDRAISVYNADPTE